mmetsp:Transcript_25144/g.58867  ORF Transcript_25144/g.58867 Transcript_25144/m.58867 type:complete len:147 (-) Transcript_25144:121-561(-)
MTRHAKQGSKKEQTNQSTMRFAAALLLPLAATTAFAPNAVPARAHSALEAFWEKAFHGSGSATTSDLDEQWETQQAILRARRGASGHNKEHLHHKYENGGPKFFQVKGSKPMLHNNPALDAPGAHADVDVGSEHQQKQKFKFFWEK